MNKNVFTSKMIEEITGLKVNTLHYYIQGGAIVPDIDLGEGTGKSRRFSETNCMEALIIKILIQYGIPRRIIISILKNIRKNDERGRLDPRELIKKDIDEYLLISHGGKESSTFAYRFVSDGGEKYSMTRKEWKSRRGLTSYNGLECINDFIITYPVLILINLSWFQASVPMREKYKIGDKYL